MSASLEEKPVIVGKYSLLHELGRGGMGVVYLAEDTRLRRRVALKVLHPALTLDTNFVERFAVEAQSIAALTHPGIVRVHAFEELDGRFIIDMEFVEGVSLDRALQGRALPKEKALTIFLRLAEALAAVHAKGLVHRDVKPSNILVADDGRVLLSDFGLATSTAFASASASTASFFLGTPKYASPESWDGGLPTQAADVYSAGLVLLEMLTGATPFDNKSPLEILRTFLDTPEVPVRDLLPEASPELAALLEGMLAADPARRLPDAREVLALAGAAPEFAGLPHISAPTLQLERIRIPGRIGARRRRKWMAGAGIAAIALGAVAMLAWRAAPDRAAPVAVAPESTFVSAPFVNPDVDHLGAAGNHVVFVASSGDWRTLWSYDTVHGTTEAIWPELMLGPRDTVFKDHSFQTKHGLVGVARREEGGVDLFRTDGTAQGTMVLAHTANQASTRLAPLAAQEERVIFNRIGGDETFGLWETDGTPEGTRHLFGGLDHHEFHGAAFGPDGGMYLNDTSVLYLSYWGQGAAGPVSITPPRVSRIEEMCMAGDLLLAEGVDLASGRELYVAGPGDTPLRLLREFMPGAADGTPGPNFRPYGKAVVFCAVTPEHGREPWITDGTAEGTRLIADVNPGKPGSAPQRFLEHEGKLYFTAITAQHGRELWVSDGTAEGTRMLADAAPGVDSGDAYALCPLGGRLLFSAYAPETGEELWVTDGTPEGTRMVADLLPGPEGSEPHGTLEIGGRAYFGANHPDHGRVLWESDGAAEGTRPVFTRLEGSPAEPPPAAPWISAMGAVFSINITAEHGAELWATDPATGHARLVRDIYPGAAGSHPAGFVHLADHIYFVADDGIHGRELWRSDGTTDGTVLIHDTFLGSGHGNPRELTPFAGGRGDGVAYFAYGGPERGNELFFYRPGTGNYDHVFYTFPAGPKWDPSGLVNRGDGWLHFSNRNPNGQTTFWRTNLEKTERLPGLGFQR